MAEPSQFLENLLKAYAKRRKGQAGSFRLEETTRRRLREEVARQFGSASPAKRSGSAWWIQLWPRLGLGTCLLVAGVFLLTRQNQVSNPPLPAGAKVDSSVAAPVPTTAPVARAGGESGSTATLRAPSVAASAVSAPAPSGSVQGPRTDAWRFSAANQNSPAARRDLDVTVATRNGAAPPLESFAFQRTEDRIQVFDSDGSLYEGMLQAPTSQSVKTSEPSSKDSAVAVVADQQDYGFVVQGTNQTLKKNVVFSGNVQFNQNRQIVAPAQKAKSERSDQNARTANALQQTRNSQLRIQGNALVGGTNAVPVDALSQER